MELLIILILGAIGGFAVVAFLFWCVSGFKFNILSKMISTKVSNEEVERIRQEEKTKYQSVSDRVSEAVIVALDKIDKRKKEKIRSLKKNKNNK